MAKHYIIMSSSYSDGERIAFDITEEHKLNADAIQSTLSQIQTICGEDVPLSVHFVETPSASWNSVVEFDPFVEGVNCISSVGTFAERIKKDRVLTGLDVAAYILTKGRCTHLSLEKLVYFAYADYLCKYSERLFEDRIFAFKHGPVIESVYQTYKKSGYQYLDPPQFDADAGFIRTDVKEMPAKSRILFARNGAEKLKSIDMTIEKYGMLSSRELVDITHRKGSPWSYVDSWKAFQTISDDLIIQYHHVEHL